MLDGLLATSDQLTSKLQKLKSKEKLARVVLKELPPRYKVLRSQVASKSRVLSVLDEKMSVNSLTTPARGSSEDDSFNLSNLTELSDSVSNDVAMETANTSTEHEQNNNAETDVSTSGAVSNSTIGNGNVSPVQPKERTDSVCPAEQMDTKETTSSEKSDSVSSLQKRVSDPPQTGRGSPDILPQDKPTANHDVKGVRPFQSSKLSVSEGLQLSKESGADSKDDDDVSETPEASPSKERVRSPLGLEGEQVSTPIAVLEKRRLSEGGVSAEKGEGPPPQKMRKLSLEETLSSHPGSEKSSPPDKAKLESNTSDPTPTGEDSRGRGGSRLPSKNEEEGTSTPSTEEQTDTPTPMELASSKQDSLLEDMEDSSPKTSSETRPQGTSGVDDTAEPPIPPASRNEPTAAVTHPLPLGEGEAENEISGESLEADTEPPAKGSSLQSELFEESPVVGNSEVAGSQGDSLQSAVDHPPSVKPTEEPSVEPSEKPSGEPPQEPSVEPPQEPSVEPSQEPSVEPPQEPSVEPSQEPSVEPSQEPSVEPPHEPSVEPTQEPSVEPTQEPSVEPPQEPSVEPTQEPSVEPSQEPSVEPSQEPSVEPPQEPSIEPSVEPPQEPSVEPSQEPSGEPPQGPSIEPPQESSIEPSVEPPQESSIEPSVEPPQESSVESSQEPSVESSQEPSIEPSQEPSIEPSQEPSIEPPVEAGESTKISSANLDAIATVTTTTIPDEQCDVTTHEEGVPLKLNILTGRSSVNSDGDGTGDVEEMVTDEKEKSDEVIEPMDVSGEERSPGGQQTDKEEDVDLFVSNVPSSVVQGDIAEEDGKVTLESVDTKTGGEKDGHLGPEGMEGDNLQPCEVSLEPKVPSEGTRDPCSKEHTIGDSDDTTVSVDPDDAGIGGGVSSKSPAATIECPEAPVSDPLNLEVPDIEQRSSKEADSHSGPSQHPVDRSSSQEFSSKDENVSTSIQQASLVGSSASIPPVENVTPEMENKSLPTENVTPETEIKSLPTEDVTPEVENKSLPTDDVTPEMENKSLPTEDVTPEVENKSLPTGDVTPEVENKSLPTDDVTPEVENKSLPTEDVTPEVENKSLPTDDVTPVMKNKSLPTGDVTPEMENKSLPTGDVTPVMENKSLPTDDVTPEMENKSLPTDDVTPEVENKSLPTEDVTPEVKNKSLPTEDVTPVMENKSLPTDDVTPEMENKSLPTDDVTPEVENKSLPTDNMTPEVENKSLPTEEAVPEMDTKSPPTKSMNLVEGSGSVVTEDIPPVDHSREDVSAMDGSKSPQEEQNENKSPLAECISPMEGNINSDNLTPAVRGDREQEVERDVGEQEVSEDVGEQEVSEDVGEQEVRVDVEEKEVSEDIKEQEVTEDDGEQEVMDDSVPEKEAKEVGSSEQPQSSGEQVLPLKSQCLEEVKRSLKGALSPVEELASQELSEELYFKEDQLTEDIDLPESTGTQVQPSSSSTEGKEDDVQPSSSITGSSDVKEEITGDGVTIRHRRRTSSSRKSREEASSLVEVAIDQQQQQQQHQQYLQTATIAGSSDGVGTEYRRSSAEDVVDNSLFDESVKLDPDSQPGVGLEPDSQVGAKLEPDSQLGTKLEPDSQLRLRLDSDSQPVDDSLMDTSALEGGEEWYEESMEGCREGSKQDSEEDPQKSVQQQQEELQDKQQQHEPKEQQQQDPKEQQQECQQEGPQEYQEEPEGQQEYLEEEQEEDQFIELLKDDTGEEDSGIPVVDTSHVARDDDVTSDQNPAQTEHETNPPQDPSSSCVGTPRDEGLESALIAPKPPPDQNQEPQAEALQDSDDLKHLDDLLDETGQSSHEQVSPQEIEFVEEGDPLFPQPSEQQQQDISVEHADTGNLDSKVSQGVDVDADTIEAQDEGNDGRGHVAPSQGPVTSQQGTGQQDAVQDQVPPGENDPSSSGSHGRPTLPEEREASVSSPPGVFGLVAYPDSPTSSEGEDEGGSVPVATGTQPLDREPETGEQLQQRGNSTPLPLIPIPEDTQAETGQAGLDLEQEQQQGTLQHEQDDEVMDTSGVDDDHRDDLDFEEMDMS